MVQKWKMGSKVSRVIGGTPDNLTQAVLSNPKMFHPVLAKV